MPHTSATLPPTHWPTPTALATLHLPTTACPPPPAPHRTAPPTHPLACSAINSTAICQSIGRNTIYGGQYDYISTFTKSAQVGGFNKLCLAPKGMQGMFAQVGGCGMLAARLLAGGPAAAACRLGGCGLLAGWGEGMR